MCLLRLPPPFPIVEGLKDLLVGPGVELRLAPREPALPVDPDSGGSTSPGVTASECLGGGHGSGRAGGAGREVSPSCFPCPQTGRPEPSMARLSSAEPTQTLARRWVCKSCQGGRGQLACGPNTQLRGTGACDSHPCLCLQDRNGNQLRAPQEVRWEPAGVASRREGVVAEESEPGVGAVGESLHLRVSGGSLSPNPPFSHPAAALPS